MKKTVILMCAFALSAGAAVLSPLMWKNSLPKGSITEMKTISYSDYVSASGELSVINEKGYVTALIPESYIYKVKEGQRVNVTGNAFPDMFYEATVKSISDTAMKNATGSVFVPVDIELVSTDDNIRSGYSVKVKIFTGDEKDISVIPYEAIKADENGNEFVYVFNSGVAVRKDIETGLETYDGVEVKNGITKDDRVIYSEEKIENGSYIVISE
ncbi:MAG: efflux RND transporter periplasmic adaptor subunit [Oscillospiraceae bacterium]